MMKRLFSALLCALITASALCVNSFAASANDLPDYTDETQAGVIVDLTDGEYLDADEIEELEEILGNTAENVGFNIGVIIADDIPDAEDYIQGEYNYQEELVENYANDCFDEIFEDDGVLLVINFHTMYDYILSDGKAEEYIQEEEIDYIFDELYDYMLDSDVYNEIKAFSSEIELYCTENAADNDGDITGITENAYGKTGILSIISGIIGLIISILGGLVQ